VDRCVDAVKEIVLVTDQHRDSVRTVRMYEWNLRSGLDVNARSALRTRHGTALKPHIVLVHYLLSACRACR